MSIFIIILIILICVVLSFFVLIQNPKGGGLSGSFGGYGNSVMGAKKSSDAVEKGTWYAALALGVVVLLSFVLAPKIGDGPQQKGNPDRSLGNVPVQSAPAPAPAPAQGSTPAPTPVPAGDAGSSQTPSPTPAPTPAPAGK